VGWIDLAQDREFAGACEHGGESPGFHKMWGFSWLAKYLLASQEGLVSKGLVG